MSLPFLEKRAGMTYKKEEVRLFGGANASPNSLTSSKKEGCGGLLCRPKAFSPAFAKIEITHPFTPHPTCAQAPARPDERWQALPRQVGFLHNEPEYKTQ